jgi:hypothetical protein
MNDKAAAARYFNESLATNPHSEIASAAREELQRLPKTPAASRSTSSDIQQARAASGAKP